MNLGKKILKIRKDNKMSQDDLAELLNVTRQTISNWENEKNYPDIETLINISNIFDISLDILLKGDEKMIKVINKNIKLGKIFKIIIPLILFIILLMIAVHLIANHSYIAKYNEKLDINLMGNEKNWNFNVNLPSGGIVKGISIPYKQNGEEITIVLMNITETVRDALRNSGWITTIDLDYKSIDFNKKIKVYYTSNKLDNIKNKPREELDKIIADSILIFENVIVESTIMCSLNDADYSYTLIYYDGNKQIINSIGDEIFPENLYLDYFNLDGENKILWFPTDKAPAVFDKIQKYFDEHNGKCIVK